MNDYTILLAEDEPAAQKHLIQIIRMKCPGFRICGVAEDGRQALEMAIELSPDVLISDIVMPVMDGLELIREIAKAVPKTRKIIVTGHQEFEYAKKALAYGVIEYLLKPINIGKLQQILSSTAEQLDQQQYECSKQEFRKLLSQPRTSSGASSADGGALLIAVIRKNGLHPKYMDHLVHDADSPIERSFFAALDPGEAEHVWLFAGRDDCEYILLARYGCVELQRFKGIVDTVPDMLPDSRYTTTVISNRVPFEQLQRTLADSYQIIRRKTVIGKSAVYTCFIQSDLQDIRFFDSSFLSRIEYMTQYENYQGLKEKIHDYIVHAEQRHLPLLQMYIDISRIFDRILEFFPERRTLNLELEVGLDRCFSQALSFAELRQDIDRLLMHMLGNLKNVDLHSEIKSSYQKIKQYINDHLADELSVPLLCMNFAISSSYLNKLFRKSDEQSVVEYIRKQRIDRSISLMSECPDIPLKDIAKMVGYEDPCYFSRIFKQEKNVSPRKYLSDMTDLSNP